MLCGWKNKKSNQPKLYLFAISLDFHPWTWSLMQHNDLVQGNKMTHRAAGKLVESLVQLQSKGLGSMNKGGMIGWSWTVERAQGLASESRLGKFLALGTPKKVTEEQIDGLWYILESVYYQHTEWLIRLIGEHSKALVMIQERNYESLSMESQDRWCSRGRMCITGKWADGETWWSSQESVMSLRYFTLD